MQVTGYFYVSDSSANHIQLTVNKNECLWKTIDSIHRARHSVSSLFPSFRKNKWEIITEMYCPFCKRHPHSLSSTHRSPSSSLSSGHRQVSWQPPMQDAVLFLSVHVLWQVVPQCEYTNPSGHSNAVQSKKPMLVIKIKLCSPVRRSYCTHTNMIKYFKTHFWKDHRSMESGLVLPSKRATAMKVPK